MELDLGLCVCIKKCIQSARVTFKTKCDTQNAFFQEFAKKGKDGLQIPPCNVCGKILKNISQRNRHEKECGEFSCPTCSKKFTELRLLTLHIKVHTNAHKCEDCSNQFECESKLRRHAIKHTKEKSYFCDDLRPRFWPKGQF